jgi:hypothetical protein
VGGGPEKRAGGWCLTLVSGAPPGGNMSATCDIRGPPNAIDAPDSLMG